MVVDEAEKTNEKSVSPERNILGLGSTDLSAITGLQALTVSTIPGLSQSIQKKILQAKEAAGSAAERKKSAAAAAPAGSAWGSRVVPNAKKSYELPAKAKPKVKEETKKAMKQGSRLG